MCITLEHHDEVVYMLPVSTKDFDINNDTEARAASRSYCWNYLGSYLKVDLGEFETKLTMNKGD